MRPDLRLLVLGLGAVVLAAVVIAVVGSGADTEPGGGTESGEEGAGDDTAASSTTAPSSPSAPTTDPPTTTTTEPPTTTTTEPPGPDLEGLDPVDIAGALVVTGLEGPDVDARLKDTVGTVCLGGVFVTESNRNWTPEDDPGAASASIERVRALATDAACPTLPLVTTDAELGAIVRVPVASPEEAPVWSAGFAADGYDTAAALYDEVVDYATALRALGVHVNFGAVADVDTDPSHFMARSGRTFGDDPAIVAALSATVVNAHCEAGVAATLKHFPNQGDTAEDPHREPSIAVGGADRWLATGRLPYLETNAPLVMTGHIVVPDVDTERPASMSAAVTTGLLRDDLGYDGVVVTDDLSTMRGASDVIPDPGQRAVAAIEAGADLVLFVRDDDAPQAIAALGARIETDPAFADRALEAYRRIWLLKAALGLVADRDAAEPGLCG